MNARQEEINALEEEAESRDQTAFLSFGIYLVSGLAAGVLGTIVAPELHEFFAKGKYGYEGTTDLLYQGLLMTDMGLAGSAFLFGRDSVRHLDERDLLYNRIDSLENADNEINK